MWHILFQADLKPIQHSFSLCMQSPSWPKPYKDCKAPERRWRQTCTSQATHGHIPTPSHVQSPPYMAEMCKHRDHKDDKERGIETVYVLMEGILLLQAPQPSSKEQNLGFGLQLLTNIWRKGNGQCCMLRDNRKKKGKLVVSKNNWYLDFKL